MPLPGKLLYISGADTRFSLCAATTVMLGIVINKGRNKGLPTRARKAFNEHRRQN